MEQPNIPSRRRFLRQLTMAGTAALLPLAMASVAEADTLTPLGKVSQFPVDQVIKTTLPAGQIVYVRRLAGAKPNFLVLNAACTHRGCPVNWQPDVKQFVCPCHGGRFDAQGTNVSGPPPSPLETIRTQVKNGTLYAIG